MTDILAHDHVEVDALFADLARAFERGEARELFAKLDYLWARLAVHIRAEHLQLFPALLAAADAAREDEAAPPREEVRAVVERLREDHDFFMRELAALVAEARPLTAPGEGGSEGLVAGIRGRTDALAARLAEHNRVEEEQVYRWPDASLDAARLEALREGLRRELENIPPRFAGRARVTNVSDDHE